MIDPRGRDPHSICATGFEATLTGNVSRGGRDPGAVETHIPPKQNFLYERFDDILQDIQEH